ncbi:MAG: penicillin-binding protein 2 [Acidobacteria bacterium]|nr:MAG: penicillin-binding protein 2 [Acidobacteriota bacterium]
MQPESNRQFFQYRLRLLYMPVAVIFLVLAARLWQLQILEGAKYATLAERNRVRTIPLVAPRGTILDCNNVPLVENRSAFNVLLYRESMKDQQATERFVAERLGVRPEELAARLRRSRGTGHYRPVVIKEDVAIEDISVVEAFKAQHPEIQLGPEPRRRYRFGKLAAHVLGYVGEVSEDELAREAFSGAKPGDLVGKSGVERVYNRYLLGSDGRRQVLVDSVGRELGVLDETGSIVGADLQLTLDFELQNVAETMLADKVGTIIAMDPRDGSVLAMASAPSFDPNSFSTRISEADWNQIVNDPNRPLQNRAIQNSYPPGSTFKLIMAMAGLEEGLVDDDTHVFCAGSAVFYNRAFHCHEKKGHGAVDLERAIIKSCNIFFYELGRRLGIERISEHAHELGLGERTGVDLPGERTGVMPSPEWKEAARGGKWFAGETISVSIGQGAISVTPIQMLRAVSAIASGGRVTTPHLLLRSERREPGPAPRWEARQLTIDTAASGRVRQGMRGSVLGGTSHNAGLAGLDICGKTGTVQVIGNERRKELKGDLSDLKDHSWFVGFGERDDPRIAVVVFLEHGGMGGLAAAPLAREIFRTYYAKRQGPDRRQLLSRSIEAPEPAPREPRGISSDHPAGSGPQPAPAVRTATLQAGGLER